MNMGVEPFLVTASLNLVVAQRLARRNCSNCAQPIEIDEETCLRIQMKPEELPTAEFKKGTGCAKCNNTGYKGRVALYEVLEMTDALRDAVLNGASTAELKEEAIRGGMQTIRRAGLNKLAEGVTTVEEVLRVSVAD